MRRVNGRDDRSLHPWGSAQNHAHEIMYVQPLNGQVSVDARKCAQSAATHYPIAPPTIAAHPRARREWRS